MLMFYYPEPPYFLLIAGLFVALTSGAAFAATLKLIIQKWSKERTTDMIARFATQRLLLPYLGISAGVCLFLSAGLEVFGFPAWLSYAVAIPITLLIAFLVWYQLGSMLTYVEKRGFQALDLDSFS